MISLAVLLAAQGGASLKPVTVPVLRAHVHDWNGRLVEVMGWMHGCAEQCFIGPTAAWHRGRGRLTLAADAGLKHSLDALTGKQVIVHGTVEEFQCAPDDICLDGADVLRVQAVDIREERRR